MRGSKMLEALESFTETRVSKVPRMEPWGMPHFTQFSISVSCSNL